MDKLLKILDSNARLTNAQLAAMLDISEEEALKRIEEFVKGLVV